MRGWAGGTGGTGAPGAMGGFGTTTSDELLLAEVACIERVPHAVINPVKIRTKRPEFRLITCSDRHFR
jgi:hypothetical protein